jgi:ubiquitin C-terminal hydrolase
MMLNNFLRVKIITKLELASPHKIDVSVSENADNVFDFPLAFKTEFCLLECILRCCYSFRESSCEIHVCFLEIL